MPEHIFSSSVFSSSTIYSWFICKMQQIYLRIFNLLILIFYLIFTSYLIPFFNLFYTRCFASSPYLPERNPLVCAPFPLLNKWLRARIYCAPGPATKTATAIAGPADLTTTRHLMCLFYSYYFHWCCMYGYNGRK